VLSVLFYWLSIVLKWCAAAQAKLQCSMCPPPFLITASRRRRYSLILLSMNRCETEFLPLGDYRSLQLFHRIELSLVVDSLLTSTRNSVIHGINIRALFGGHMWGSMKLMCSFCRQSIVVRAVCAGAPSCCSVHLSCRHIALMSGSRPFSRTILQ